MDIYSGKVKATSTILVFSVIVCAGLLYGIVGLTMVAMERLLCTDTAQMGVALSFMSGGQLFGSILAGLLFERFSREAQMSAISGVQSLAIMSAPYTGNIYGYTALMTVMAITKGFALTAMMSQQVIMWHGHRLKDSVVQASNMMWSLGVAVTGFLVYPFLKDVKPDDDGVTNWFNQTNMTSGSMQSNAQCNETSDEDATVRHAFLVIGVLPALNCFAFFILFVYIKYRLNTEKAKSSKDPNAYSVAKNSEVKIRLWYRIIFCTFMITFYFLYISIESPLGDFLSVFCQKGFGFSVKFSSVLVSTLWISNTVGRFLGALLACCLPPFLLGFTCIVAVLIGYIMLVFTKSLPMYGLIIAVSIVGLSLGPIASAYMGWISNYIRLGSFVTSLCFVGIGVGQTAFAPIVGYAMEYLGHMWLVYIPIITCSADIVLLVIHRIFVKVAHKSNVASDRRESECVEDEM